MQLVDYVKQDAFTKEDLNKCLDSCDDGDLKKELLNAMNDILLTREITSTTDKTDFKRLIDKFIRISTISKKERDEAVAAMCKFSGLAFKAGAASAAANDDFTTLIPQHYASRIDITITYDIDNKQRGNLQRYVSFLLAELAAQLNGKREIYAYGENQLSFNAMKSFFTSLPMKPTKLSLIALNLNLNKLLNHLRANNFDFANLNVIDRAEDDDEVEVITVRNMDMRILTLSTHNPLPSGEYSIEQVAESLATSQEAAKLRVETPGYTSSARTRTKTSDTLLKQQKTTDREEIQKYFGKKLEFTVTTVDAVSTVEVKKAADPMTLVKFTAVEDEDGNWKSLAYVAGERASVAPYQERLQILTFIAEQAVKANKKLKEPRLMLKVKATCADNYIMNAFVIMNCHMVPYFNAAGRDAIIMRINELGRMNPRTMSPEDAMILRMGLTLLDFKADVGGDPVWIKAAKGTKIAKTSTMLIERAFAKHIIPYWEASLTRNASGMTPEAIQAMTANIAFTKQNSEKTINYLISSPTSNKQDDCVAGTGTGNKKTSMRVSPTRGNTAL